MLIGTYKVKLTEGGRAILPIKFRNILQDEGLSSIYLYYGNNDCIEIHLKKNIESLINMNFTDFKMFNEINREFSRRFFPNLELVTFDSQGRINLDKEMKDFSGNQLVIIGLGNYAEIWDWDKWKSKYTNKHSELLELANKLKKETSKNEQSA